MTETLTVLVLGFVLLASLAFNLLLFGLVCWLVTKPPGERRLQSFHAHHHLPDHNLDVMVHGGGVDDEDLSPGE